jgi:hypothetical protein
MRHGGLVRRMLAGYAVLATGICAAMAATPAHASTPAPKEPGSLNQEPANTFPPKANSAWAYDTSSPGTWVNAVTDYNKQAMPGHELNEVYSYATDLEMYCPNNDGTQCTANDLYSYYTAGGSGRARTDAYYQAFDAPRPGSLIISPIIDGRTDTGGYLQGFNQLSPELAADFADMVASQVCADPHVDGIQFDIEPFDVTTRNGQYDFYMRIAKDFAGEHAGNPAQDPYGCVDAAHPRGRFFSVFTFAASIEPGTESAANVQEIMNSYGNGYFMDSLYDLSSAPAGTLNGIAPYRAAVQREATDMKRWADRLHIKYGYGIPASASAHEFTTCNATPSASGSCVPDATGATGYPMIEYTKAAVNAIDRTGALRDSHYLGAAIWDFGDHVSVNGLDFGPVPAPADVLSYLATNLPGAENHELARR